MATGDELATHQIDENIVLADAISPDGRVAATGGGNNNEIHVWELATGAPVKGASLHNIYTLRGAPVRVPLNWSKYIGAALYRSGLEAEVMFASHKYEIHDNVYEIPKGLQNKWFCRGYHGSPQHNSRGVIQRYLGFWDYNPATLIPLSPRDSAPPYVEMMGGPDRIMERGRELPDEGKYLMASGIVNKLVQADSNMHPAKDLPADIFEQLGYQQESPGVRKTVFSPPLTS